MDRLPALALAAALLVATPVALGDSQSEDTNASFDTARVNDDLRGFIADPAQDDRVSFYATAGSTLSATLTPDSTLGDPATGVSLTLCKADGTEVVVAGTKADKSKEGKDQVKWRKAPLDMTATYVLIVRVDDGGGWRLKLAGVLSKTRIDVVSSEPLSVGAEAGVDFEGLDGGTVKPKVTPQSGTKFAGTITRVEDSDGNVVYDATVEEGDPIVLARNGTHTVFFQNSGRDAGGWKAKVVCKPPTVKKRRGYLYRDGTALVPKVRKLDPSRAVHFQDDVQITAIGRDFQPGVDARLVRKGFDDIVGTNVRVISETEVRFEVNLDTEVAEAKDTRSIGAWKVGVWNRPQYTVLDDPTTLIKDSPTKQASRVFSSVTASSITLPRGLRKGTEVWHVDFNDGFQFDLNRMGLGSIDPVVEARMRESVEAYVILFLRHLFGVNETTGELDAGIPVSFIIARPTSVAGKAGEDYNRIEVGGKWENGDPQDPTEPLFWGFAAVDPGNTSFEDLTEVAKDDQGSMVRVGDGARLRVLDTRTPAANVSASFGAAMAPLVTNELTTADRRYFNAGFFPQTQFQANRYADIVAQTERASREIAAIIAHHIGKAMGLPGGGSGPMANPSEAGNMWPELTSLQFSASDTNTLRGNLRVSDLPGKSGSLAVTYFPVVGVEDSFLPNLTTDENYSVKWNFVGGRPNAVPSDYKVRYTRGGAPVFGLALSFDGLTGKAPLFLATNLFYCGISIFEVRVTDKKRGGARRFLYRINVLPNIPKLPAALRVQATACRDQVLAN